MKFKYTGEQDEITVRHVTFAKGEAVELDLDDPDDADLAEKIEKWAEMEPVKPGRKAKRASAED